MTPREALQALGYVDIAVCAEPVGASDVTVGAYAPTERARVRWSGATEDAANAARVDHEVRRRERVVAELRRQLAEAEGHAAEGHAVAARMVRP